MTRSNRALLATTAIVAAFTLGSGIVHGWISQRWGPPTNIGEVSDALESLPENVGDWTAFVSNDANDRTRSLLRCDGYVGRRYRNDRTKEVVELTVVLGPSGPLSVHQPEICFLNHAYHQRDERQETTFDVDGATNSLWAITFDPAPSNIDGRVVRIYYGWSPGHEWSAPSDARFAFAGKTYLYKLQVSCSLPVSVDVNATDPCRDFLSQLIPVLGDHLRTPGQV